MVEVLGGEKNAIPTGQKGQVCQAGTADRRGFPSGIDFCEVRGELGSDADGDVTLGGQTFAEPCRVDNHTKGPVPRLPTYQVLSIESARSTFRVSSHVVPSLAGRQASKHLAKLAGST